MLSSSFIISLLLAAAIARSEGAAFLRPVAEPNKRIRLCGPPLLQYIFANKLYECEGVASGGVKPNHCLLHKRLHACRAAERDLLCTLMLPPPNSYLPPPNGRYACLTSHRSVNKGC